MGKTFEVILNEMLEMVSDSVDKREGSLIWSALAPTAAQLAEGYAFFDCYADLLLADTAVGTYLDRLCDLMGLSRKGATASSVIGEFRNFDEELMDVDLGLDFVCGSDVYTVVSQISTGKYLLTAKTLGKSGNRTKGTLLPVDYIEDLMSAEIVGIVDYGDDAESDESLRKRYLDNLTVPAFGGNVSDYEKKVLEFDGIGFAKVFPVCEGPGTVGIVVGSDCGRAVDGALTAYVENEFNKTDENNMSCGLAPIGHSVRVKSAEELPIDIVAYIRTESGTITDSLTAKVKSELRNYIDNIDFGVESILKAPLEMAILSVDGVVDILELTINGSDLSFPMDKTYDAYYVPVFATLILEVL